MRDKIRGTFRHILHYAIALIAGMLVAMLVEGLGHQLYPVDGLVPGDKESIKKYLETAPLMAIVFVVIAHAIGSFAAGTTITLLEQSRAKFNVLVVGIIFMVLGVYNWISIPHPEWFKIADTIVYVPFAYLGYLVFRKKQ